jgi:DNA-directed RNA polymerase specialized sigma24 family protein
MTQAEAAGLLDVSAVTVKRWLSRVLRFATEQLADLRPGEEPPDAI